MKSWLALSIVVAAACTIGYLEIGHQAQRESWRVETIRLQARVEQAERLSEERRQALAAMERDVRKARGGKEELADLETRILDAAAELARLESDRDVARERADAALHDLKEQVTALTTIESDMASLGKRRQILKRQVTNVEDRLQQAEIGAAKRQKRSEALDRDIAGLAIRREALLSNLEAAERSMAGAALAKVVEESVKAAPPVETKAEPQPIPAAAPAVGVEPAAALDEDRPRGLYQFGSLSADPEAAGDQRQASLQEDPGQPDEEATADWMEEQYLLGLRLLAAAERNSGTRELSDAVLAFKAVLGELPKEEDPMRWAIARSDLGYALALLGKRRNDEGALEQAVDASRDALGTFEPKETPLLWAAAQQHLGISLGGLADIRDDQGLRQASIDALEQAVDMFEEAGADTDARNAARRLSDARTDLEAESPE